MAGNIAKISVEAVQAAISNYEARKSDFQNVVNGIKGAFFDLEDTWKGAAEQTYESQLRELLKNLETIFVSMDGAKAKLQLALQTYEETENAQVSAINAVEAGEGDYVV